MRPDFSSLPQRYTFTVDVEDHLPAALGSRRFEAMTLRLLDLLDEHGGSGTFFVVGEIAERAPGLVRAIAQRGHEVACHGHRHVPLDRLPEAGFGTSLVATKRRLEDLAGEAVLGFRAPCFSLRAGTAWAVEQVERAGFRYSSSVLPARLPGTGIAGAPCGPFWWHGSALLEIPCPVGSIGPFRVPCLGGLYLRYLPSWRLRQLLRTLSTEGLWTYSHPYDVDLAEPFRRLRDVGTAVSFLLWWRRRRFAERLTQVMAGRTSMSFKDRLGELRALASRRPSYLLATPAPGRRWRKAKPDLLSPVRGGTR
jgi:polysaccharide deacetylase family protein (PEP-CTERM system associated)